MVDMILRRTKLTDARGHKRSFRTIKSILNQSKLTHDDLINSGATHSLPRAFVTAAQFWFVGIFGGLSYLELTTGRGYEYLVEMPVAGYIYALTVLYVVFMGIYIHRHKWGSKAKLIGSMTQLGYCPSCAYRVSDCEPEPDGCTVCPECGGAWRLDG